MFDRIAKSLILLAQSLPKPLYVVGGAVRDHLIGFREKTTDWDICSPMLAEEFAAIATAHGFTINAVYRNTGTVKLHDYENNEFEFSSFRSDEYVRGEHRPAKIFFTQDMEADARRRDFTCNAVYYCIREGKFYDPLCGERDIREKKMRTVREARRVFGEDGLRLMRLAMASSAIAQKIPSNTHI